MKAMTRKNILLIFLSFFSFLAPSLAAKSAKMNADTTVVLVHGAFADGSSWNKIIPLLRAEGLKVVAVQNPLNSLAEDVEYTQRVVNAQTGNVILAGHSWGGTVITQAGSSDKVKALVYIAAFVPDVGEASSELGKDFPVTAGLSTLKPDADGYIYLSEDSLQKNFAQDLSKAETKVMFSTQGPVAGKAFGDKVTVASWKNKPNYYLVAENDRMINPDLQKAFAKKINASTTVLKTSHVPMLSQPKKVAAFIIEVASKINLKK